MKKPRLIWCVYLAFSFGVLLLSVCEIKRNNPLDEGGNTFVPPQIFIDTTGAGVGNGDTIHFDSATVMVAGNKAECRFRVSIDSGSWTPWQSIGKFHFDSLDDGKHAIVMESKYDGGTVFIYDTMVFHVLTAGYKPAYPIHLDSIIQTDTGTALSIVAEAAGMKPIAYGWKKGESVIAGKSKDTLIIPDVQCGDSGSYRCFALNEWGVDTSRFYKIKIVYPPPPTYTVIYDDNHSSNGTVPVDVNVYEKGATVTVKANIGNLAKTGYVFAGWNTSADGSGASYAAGVDFIMGSGNVVLYAKWTKNPTYTVTYNGNGNTSGSIPADANAYEQGATVTVKGNTGNLVNSGYSFVGWNTAADGSGTSYAAGVDFNMGQSNVILYAKWTQNPTYNVTYNGNGNTSGTVPADANSYEQGSTVTVLGNTGNLAKTGFTFIGWSTTADGSGTSYATGATFSLGSGNVVLYAKWTQNPTYTVVYIGNGSTSGSVPIDANAYLQGAIVTVKGNTGNLVKPGYNLAGWTITADGSGTTYTSGATLTMATANVTFYAKWVISTFAVSFNSNGGTGVAGQTVAYDSMATQPTAPTKTGYGFSGWYSDSLLATAFSFSTPITASTTLYAKWVIGTYTVMFNSNGGSAVANQTVAYSSTATQPTAPTKTGSTFAYWCSDSLLTNQYNFATPVVASITLYAKWTINLYTVSFNSNGGSAVASQTVGYSSTATQPTAPTKAGYGFSGWYSDSLLTSAFSFSTSITAAITLYAKWTVNTYTVSFNSNGGSTVANQTIAHNSTVILPTPAPTRTGYGFSGWYSDSLLTMAFSSSTPITAAITLYAKWTITSYTVSFNSNGGNTVGSQTIAYNSTATLPTPAPTKAGYGFSGWYSDSLLTTAFGFSTPITTAITLYAKWTINTYTVTFNTNGGSAVANETIVYNFTAIQPTSAPTKFANTFSGWYSDSLFASAFNFSIPITGATTLYAKWTPINWTAANSGLTRDSVYCLAVCGSTIFAGTVGGVFSSTDNGTSWHSSGLTNYEVVSLAVSNGKMFAGAWGGGAHFSSDTGTTWTAIDSGLTDSRVVALAANNGNIFCGTPSHGVLLSTNDGISWTEVNSGLPNAYVYSLVVSESNIIVGENPAGVFQSSNNGMSWTGINSGLTTSAIMTLAVGDSNMFVGTYGGGVFISPKNGANWTAINSGITDVLIYSLAVSGSKIFAGTAYGGIFVSNNNGISWAAINAGIPSSHVTTLIVKGNTIFAGLFGGGVYFLPLQ
jgi:uncharacterized repeat protein (TIGR02543 family)